MDIVGGSLNSMNAFLKESKMGGKKEDTLQIENFVPESVSVQSMTFATFSPQAIELSSGKNPLMDSVINAASTSGAQTINERIMAGKRASENMMQKMDEEVIKIGELVLEENQEIIDEVTDEGIAKLEKSREAINEERSSSDENTDGAGEEGGSSSAETSDGANAASTESASTDTESADTSKESSSSDDDSETVEE